MHISKFEKESRVLILLVSIHSINSLSIEFVVLQKWTFLFPGGWYDTDILLSSDAIQEPPTGPDHV